MVSLIETAQTADYPADITLVISNRPEALGLEKARALGVQAMAIDHQTFPSRESFEQALHAVLSEAGIELVCCAGFMRVLTPWFVSRWAGRLLNIHPSLLPKYKGLNTHERALANGDSVHGCTVHHVTAELDSGSIILQESLPILPNDTPDSLAARLITIEHRIYPEALDKVAKGLN